MQLLFHYVGSDVATQPPWPHPISDDGVEKRGNINTAALVTIVQCNILVV